MELYEISLRSPLWWLSVLVGSVLIGVLSSVVLARHGRRCPPPRLREVEDLVRALRLRIWVVNLLVLANVGMLVGLSAVNLRIPSIGGPVSLAFVVLCLLSLTLATLVYIESAHLTKRWRPSKEP